MAGPGGAARGWAGSLTVAALSTGFAELQTDMTDLTKELNRSQGIPFLEYKHFVTRTFFPKVHTLPHALVTTRSFRSLFSWPHQPWFPFSPTLFLCFINVQLSVWKATVLASMLACSALSLRELSREARTLPRPCQTSWSPYFLFLLVVQDLWADCPLCNSPKKRVALPF